MLCIPEELQIMIGDHRTPKDVNSSARICLHVQKYVKNLAHSFEHFVQAYKEGNPEILKVYKEAGLSLSSFCDLEDIAYDAIRKGLHARLRTLILFEFDVQSLRETLFTELSKEVTYKNNPRILSLLIQNGFVKNDLMAGRGIVVRSAMLDRDAESLEILMRAGLTLEDFREFYSPEIAVNSLNKFALDFYKKKGLRLAHIRNIKASTCDWIESEITSRKEQIQELEEEKHRYMPPWVIKIIVREEENSRRKTLRVIQTLKQSIMELEEMLERFRNFPDYD